MMLQLPIWRYPAVVIFSLGLHGILLLIIFSEYRRNPPPSQIEWFDLREMSLTPSEIKEKSQSASAISAISAISNIFRIFFAISLKFPGTANSCFSRVHYYRITIGSFAINFNGKRR